MAVTSRAGVEVENVLSCGVDVVELDSLAHSIEVGRENFLSRIFTERELTYCHGRLPQLAARFAAKEAVSKALGTGLRGIRWQDIEVQTNEQGQPSLRLSGSAATRAKQLRIREWTISLAHSESLAVAMVISYSERSASLRR